MLLAACTYLLLKLSARYVGVLAFCSYCLLRAAACCMMLLPLAAVLVLAECVLLFANVLAAAC
jgi:hypothetical protein